MSSDTTKNPNGGVASRHFMKDRPLNPVTVEHVIKRDNILRAWKQVRANKGACGVDKCQHRKFPCVCS